MPKKKKKPSRPRKPKLPAKSDVNQIAFRVLTEATRNK
jgi:hypothetical protein